MNFGAIKDAIRRDFGFDITDAKAGEAANERYQQAVADSKWLMAQVSIATTTAGVGAYDLADDIVDLDGLYVTSGGQQSYKRVGTKELWDLKAGTTWISDSRWGVFAPQFKADGTRQIELFPAPSETGATISGLAALIPPPMAAASDTPNLPIDLHEPICVFGGIATWLAKDAERLDDAGYFEQQYAAAVQKLSRRKNSRIGSGPVVIGFA